MTTAVDVFSCGLPSDAGTLQPVPSLRARALPDGDAELMLRVKEGDGRSFGVLVEAHRSSVVHFLYRMVQNQAVAEELAQEVFMRVYRARHTYEPTARFKAWLFQIAAHLGSNSRRDGRHERFQERLDHEIPGRAVRQVSDRRPSIEQVMVFQVKLAEVRRAVAALPEKQRAAVLMHKYAGMDYAQIAAALHCTVPAVKSLLFRAYETLRERLAHMASS